MRGETTHRLHDMNQRGLQGHRDIQTHLMSMPHASDAAHFGQARGRSQLLALLHRDAQKGTNVTDVNRAALQPSDKDIALKHKHKQHLAQNSH